MDAIKRTLVGKWHALATLTRMVAFLSNWREVWTTYKRGVKQPPYRFKTGFVINHGPWDEPVDLLHEIISKGTYRKFISQTGSGTVVDIGANIGMVTLDLASRFPGLEFQCYEPNPATNETLHRNVVESGFSNRVTVNPQAVGRSSGQIQFWVDLPSYMATASAYSAAPPHHGSINTAATARQISVPMVGLNEVFARVKSGPVVLLKIDAEGAEADILEGAAPSVFERVSNVALEYHGDRCEKALERCRTVLQKNGFQVSNDATSESSGILYGWKR